MTKTVIPDHLRSEIQLANLVHGLGVTLITAACILNLLANNLGWVLLVVR